MADASGKTTHNPFGWLMIGLGFAIFIAGLSSLRPRADPVKDDLIELHGVAYDVDGNSWTRYGKGEEEIRFSLGGKRFACSTSLENYHILKQAIAHGEPLSVLIDPNNSGVTIGPLWKYWTIRVNNREVVSFREMVKRHHEGGFATKVVTIVLSSVICIAFVVSGIKRLKRKPTLVHS